MTWIDTIQADPRHGPARARVRRNCMPKSLVFSLCLLFSFYLLSPARSAMVEMQEVREPPRKFRIESGMLYAVIILGRRPTNLLQAGDVNLRRYRMREAVLP